MALDPADLKLRIEGAFGGMSYPGDEQIVCHNSGCWECENIKSALKGFHWRDVSFEALDNLRMALSFMSPEGFRFYLPALMIISVMDYHRADFIPDSVVSRLTPPHASDLDRAIEEDKHIAQQLNDDPRAAEIFASMDRERINEMMADYYRSGEAERRFLKCVSGLNEAQGKVIRLFLEYMRDAHSTECMSEDAGRAIERYWHQFSLP